MERLESEKRERKEAVVVAVAVEEEDESDWLWLASVLFSSQFALRSYLYILFHELVGRPTSWLFSDKRVYILHQMPLVYLKNKHASIIWCNFNFMNRGRLWCSWKILFFGFEMEANNKTKDDGSAESLTSVLEDEVCFVFFVWCSSTKNKPSGLICREL